MKVIWKCKECEGGPCYVCAPNQVTQGSMYDTGGAYPPPICPYSPHFERAEFEEVPTYSIAHSPFDSLIEWLNDEEGYEKCSAPLRDAIFSGWFDTKYDQIEGGIAARNALMTLEECHGATWTLDLEEIEKLIKQVKKLRLAEMAWSRGFQAGLMAAERIRVELEEKTKNGWTPW